MQDAKAKYRIIFENTSTAIIILEGEGMLISLANSEAERILGYSKREMEGKRSWAEFVFPGDLERVKEHDRMRRDDPNSSCRNCEFRIVDRSGNIRDFLMNIAPIPGNEKKRILSLVDISDRRQAEEALRKAREALEVKVQELTTELRKAKQALDAESVERLYARYTGKRMQKELRKTTKLLEKVFSSMNILICYMDGEFNIVQVNRAFAKAHGGSPEFYVGKNYFVLFPSEEHNATFRSVVQSGEPYFAYEKPFHYAESPGREVTYWDWSLEPVKESDGRVSGTILSLIDVTNRKLAEEAAKTEHAFRKAIEDSIISGIAAFNLHGHHIYVNSAFCRMVGWSEKELVGMNPPFSYWPPEEMESIADAFQQTIGNKVLPRRFELRFRRRNEERFDVLALASPLTDSQGKTIGWVASFGDITSFKRTEQALRESEEELRLLSSRILTAQENERKWICQELHDSIGQQLSAIKYGVENAHVQAVKTADDACIKLLEPIVQMVQDTIEEVRRIGIRLRPSVLDEVGIIATISWFCREFQKIYSDMRIEKSTDLPESGVPVPLKIVIFRVLQEAMNNIAKHSKADLVRLSLGETDGVIELQIEDNGLGFDGVNQLPAASLEGKFGLVSMRERVENSGGTFAIESTPGTGTIVRASWPLEGN